MNGYQNKYFLVFGGASVILKAINMRLCLNDLFMFDTKIKKWEQMPDNKYTPKVRMSHVTSIMGCLMLLQGGYNTETRTTYDDIHLFDIDIKQWIRCIVGIKKDHTRNQ